MNSENTDAEAKLAETISTAIAVSRCEAGLIQTIEYYTDLIEECDIAINDEECDIAIKDLEQKSKELKKQLQIALDNAIDHHYTREALAQHLRNRKSQTPFQEKNEPKQENRNAMPLFK